MCGFLYQYSLEYFSIKSVSKQTDAAEYFKKYPLFEMVAGSIQFQSFQAHFFRKMHLNIKVPWMVHVKAKSFLLLALDFHFDPKEIFNHLISAKDSFVHHDHSLQASGDWKWFAENRLVKLILIRWKWNEN